MQQVKHTSKVEDLDVPRGNCELTFGLEIKCEIAKAVTINKDSKVQMEYSNKDTIKVSVKSTFLPHRKYMLMS